MGTHSKRSPTFFSSAGCPDGLSWHTDLNSILRLVFFTRAVIGALVGSLHVQSVRWTRVVSFYSIPQCNGSQCSCLTSGLIGVLSGVWATDRCVMAANI